MALRIFVIPPSAMLTDRLPHGDGLAAMGFIRELGARGHELHVAAPRVDLSGELPDNVRLHPLQSDAQRLRDTRLGFMGRLRRLFRRLPRSSEFDLIHQLNPVDVGVSLALAEERVPVVLGPYVPDWAPSGVGADAVTHPASLQLKRVLRAAQQRLATTALLSTPAAASKLERCAGPALHVHELPFGIDERAWRPGGETTGQQVLFLANLELRKGIHVLLDAFARLAPDLPEARLRVAGDGPEAGAVRRRIGDSPFDRVELIARRMARDEVMATMRTCDVYCLPSYGEPFGMTALEAMACARPVVATDAGGLGHLVSERGGRKAPPGDEEALAEALRTLLVDPELRRSMGRHNRALVEGRYAWARVVDRLEQVYREAIREPRPRGRTLSRARSAWRP